MPSVAIIGTRGYPSYYGGFETAVRRLAPYLVDQGWNVSVYGRPGTTHDADPDRDPRVRSIVTHGIEKRSLSTLTFGLTAAIHAARAKPDVALVMNVANGYWLPILRQAGVPTVVNVDGIEWEREKWGRMARGTFRGGAKWTAKYGNELVCDSQVIQQRWVSEFGRQGEFIPYGGDEAPPDMPLEPGLTHRGYVLVVARFVPENTIAEFFAAATELAGHHDVVIVGSAGYGGEFDEQAGRLAAENDRVRWLGHVSDDQRLLGLWQHAGVYFHGHSVGGTNPALVQAMACGAPIVARDTPYNREVLAECGSFTEPTPDTIADAIQELLGDRAKRDRLSTQAIQRARDRYSWDLICSQYASLLSSAIQLSRPS